MVKTGLIIAGGIILVGAAAYAGYRIYKKLSLANSEQTDEDKAKEEFAASAGAFSGLYEPLYKMAKGGAKYRAGVIGDWAVRTKNLENADHYCALWGTKLADAASWDSEQALVKINELLSFVRDAGVLRDNTELITVDGNTYKNYVAFDGERIESGSQALVKAPYWFISDKILEKGMIEKI